MDSLHFHPFSAFSTTNRKYKYYRNKVQRKVETKAPNLVWVSDLTNVYVKNTPYSIAVIIDLYARVVVAFDVRANATAKRMIGLFDTAFEQRQRPDRGQRSILRKRTGKDLIPDLGKDLLIDRRAASIVDQTRHLFSPFILCIINIYTMHARLSSAFCRIS